MTYGIDETHDASRRSWIASADGHAIFPLQNLPFGIFSPAGGTPRGGVAIGDDIFDLGAAVAAGLFEGGAKAAAAAAATT
jgi:fumarylacetoacetase